MNNLLYRIFKRPVTNAALCAAALGTLTALTACSARPDADRLSIALGDVDDYQAFLDARGNIEAPAPFEPEPLSVSAVGKVQARPDIAVITARITARDKNESRAVNEMGEIINAVQSALKGRDIETGFTAVQSIREFDEACRDENRFAQRRQDEIRRDYYFNKRLDERGDKETKRRDPKARVPQIVCFAQTLKVSTQMVIRIKPADAAGEVLRALSDAGAQDAQLYGYDFTNYDALYQQAAVTAVKQAKIKAETIARTAGGVLGEIESFFVDAPAQTGRFGPQPSIIRNANRHVAPHGSVLDRHLSKQNNAPRLAAQKNRYANTLSDEVPAAATRRLEKSFAAPAPIAVDLSFVGAVPPNRKILLGSQNKIEPQANIGTNALSISLLSGPQTIEVRARLSYSYDTPLNGKIITDSSKES